MGTRIKGLKGHKPLVPSLAMSKRLPPLGLGSDMMTVTSLGFLNDFGV